jgi:hypothetical protein
VSITAYPIVTVGGQTVSNSAGGTSGLVGVEELRITWGRAEVLDQPTPARLALTLLDRQRGRPFARRPDLVGEEITVEWRETGTGTSGMCFRGRITDATAAPPTGAHADRPFRVQLQATSREADLAQYTAPQNSVWAAGESFAARATRILALVPADQRPSVGLPRAVDLGLTDPGPTADLDTYPAGLLDASGKHALELMRQLFASMSPQPMVYQPTANRLTFAPRRRRGYASGHVSSARLTISDEHGGRWVVAGLGGRHLDAQKLAYTGGLEQTIDTQLTQVEVSYPDAAASNAPRSQLTATAAAANEATKGRRTALVRSMHSEAARAKQLADLYATADADSRHPRLGSVGWSSAREPLDDATMAAALLSCAEDSHEVFLNRSWLPQLGRRPLVGFIGGTVGYADGEWSADLNTAPVIVDPAPQTWAPVTIGALAISAATRLRDLDPQVTLGDLGFVDIGAGFTQFTVQPYKGNPS